MLFQTPSLLSCGLQAADNLPPIYGPSKGTRQIRVILYATLTKSGPFLGNGTGGRASGEDILAVEHDVIPLDWADAFQQGEIDSFATGSY